MFERTASLWRRLTGRGQHLTPAAATSVAEDERRVYVRFPSSVETQLTPLGEEQQPTLTGRIRDVSLGGLKLLVGRPFEPGEVLSVTLPGEGSSSMTVLACVAHCQALSNKEWAIGCSFSAELSESELETFGARKAKAGSADDRGWTRFPCEVTVLCQLLTTPDLTPLLGKVLNISANGMALQLEEDLTAGTLITAELHGAHGRPPLTILACVVHVTVQPDGQRFIGCSFIRELSETDLKKLL